jgi:hypothetical protein
MRGRRRGCRRQRFRFYDDLGTGIDFYGNDFGVSFNDVSR